MNIVLSKKERFLCEIIWGGIPSDVDFVLNSTLFKQSLASFNNGKWLDIYKNYG
jgi:hypothetical protein